jgi:hypothetical protein
VQTNQTISSIISQQFPFNVLCVHESTKIKEYRNGFDVTFSNVDFKSKPQAKRFYFLHQGLFLFFLFLLSTKHKKSFPGWECTAQSTISTQALLFDEERKKRHKKSCIYNKSILEASATLTDYNV